MKHLMTIFVFSLMIAANVPLFAASGAAQTPSSAATQPAPAKAPEKAVSKPVQTAVTEGISITVDELKSLLARKETPRVSITNTFGGKVTGKATSVENDKVLLDVSAEGVGVEGALGVPLSSVVSVTVLVPLTEDEIAASRKASAEYLAALRGPGVAKEPSNEALASTESLLPPGAASSTESLLTPAVSSTESSVNPPAAVSSTESEIAAGETETKIDYLQMYPPKEGWGPKRLAEIVRKAVVLRLEPFGKDKTFIKDYDAWKKAYENKRNEQLEQEAAYKGMGQEPPAGFEVLPELTPVPSLEGAPSPGGEQPVGNDSDEAPVGAPSEPSGGK